MRALAAPCPRPLASPRPRLVPLPPLPFPPLPSPFPSPYIRPCGSTGVLICRMVATALAVHFLRDRNLAFCGERWLILAAAREPCVCDRLGLAPSSQVGPHAYRLLSCDVLLPDCEFNLSMKSAHILIDPVRHEIPYDILIVACKPLRRHGAPQSPRYLRVLLQPASTMQRRASWRAGARSRGGYAGQQHQQF